MKKYCIIGIFAFLNITKQSAQSIELMPGDQYVFTDVQFLRSFDKAYRFTLFSRTRAQIDYDDQVDFFTAGYLNYTTKIGLGVTGLARINNVGSNVDTGIHFLKNTKNISFFGLASVSLTEDNTFSWFSIFRYRPSLNEDWKIYTSVELFTVLNNSGHAASIQRIRLGPEYKTFQFGVAANLLELGDDFDFFNNNYGIFIRKEF